MRLLITLLLLLSGHLVAQVPSVSFMDFNVRGNEEYPVLEPSPAGGYFMTHTSTSSSPDSTLAILTRLNANLDVVWSRVYRMRPRTTITGVEAKSDGSCSLMLNSYQTASRYYPMAISVSAQGTITENIELMDSANLNQMSPFYYQTRLQNGSRILISSSIGYIVRLNASNQVTYARQFGMTTGNDRNLYFAGLLPVPGTNEWYGYGRIHNTNLSFLMHMSDTSLVHFRVYTFDLVNTFYGISNLHRYPNGDLLGSHVYNSAMLHMYRLSPAGEIIWRRTYKLPGSNFPGAMTVGPDGDIWMHGSITPGQAGGVLTHFSPTGDYLGQGTQFRLGVSLGNMSSLAVFPNNELVTFQRGYYSNKPTLVLNRINSSINFLCYNTNPITLIDTTFAIVDSAVSKVVTKKIRIGTTTTPSFPLLEYSPQISRGAIVCTPNAVAETETEAHQHVYPNPSSGSIRIQGLMPGQPIEILSSDGRSHGPHLYTDPFDVQDLKKGLYLIRLPNSGQNLRLIRE